MSYFECLQKGSQGDRVHEIQTHLNNWGYPLKPSKPLEVDGIFGDETEKAVRQFQKDKGLTVDGVVGEETYKILSQPPIRLIFKPSEILHLGSQGKSVCKVQESLQEWGFPLAPAKPLKIDGIFGTLTQEALVQFQQQAKLPQSKVFDSATSQLLCKPSVTVLIDKFNQENISQDMRRRILYQLTTISSKSSDYKLSKAMEQLDIDTMLPLLIEDIKSNDSKICCLATKCLPKLQQKLQPKHTEVLTSTLVSVLHQRDNCPDIIMAIVSINPEEAKRMNLEQPTTIILFATLDDWREWIINWWRQHHG